MNSTQAGADMRILRPIDDANVTDVWVDVLYERLMRELEEAQFGHCLRLSDLPRPILEHLAKRLCDGRPMGIEIYLVDQRTGPEPWRVGVHKVVERRNAEAGAVLALFPPDLLLAAGDSVDVSTFRAIPIIDIPERVAEMLAQRMPQHTRAWAQRVLDNLRQRGWPVSQTAQLAYLATIAAQEQGGHDGGNLSVVGGALYVLGLIPDFALLDRPDEFHYRLGQRNIPTVKRLSDLGATPLERVLRLPLSDEGVRARLIALFAAYSPGDITGWGQAVATDAAWCDLSLDRWPLGAEAPPPGEVRIDIEPLKLPRRPEDGLLYLDTTQKTAVVWQTSPPPIDVPGLAYFRIEVVNSDRVTVWESPLIKGGTGKTARRTRTLKDLVGLDSGIYFFRVIALNEAGDPFPAPGIDLDAEESDEGGKQSNESENFLIEVNGAEEVAEEFEPVATSGVRGYAQAELLARWAALTGGKSGDVPRAPVIVWGTPLDARSETAVATVRFGVHQHYAVRLSQRLRRLEVAILHNADAGGHCRLSLGPQQGGEAELMPLVLPSHVATARRAVFDAIGREDIADGGLPVVALVNLCALASLIEAYAEAYRAWLDEGSDEALRLDVTLAETEYGTVALLAPTHPLRLLWALQEQQIAHAWLDEARERRTLDKGIVNLWQQTFAPHALPLTLVLDAGAGYLDAGPLIGGWGAYLPPRVKDSRTVLSTLRRRLGLGVAYRSEADAPPHLLTDKLELFLRQHAYTPALVLNVINPGDAALVTDALVELERRRARVDLPLRYHVRLFTDEAQTDVGQAFRDLVNPNSPISEAAGRLAGPGRSFLFPKLSWSRGALREFLQEPDRFTAHVTLILDAFAVELRTPRADSSERTSFVHGLVQDIPRSFVGQQTYTWVRRPAPADCQDLAAARGRSGLIAAVLAAIAARQAQVLSPNADATDAVAAVSLSLNARDQALFYSAHAVSTWVLTLDPHLGLDYFDSARRGDRPGYLLDFTPEFVASGGRQLLLTTSIDAEVSRIMAPAAAQVGLNDDTQGAQLLLEALRSLSGRLALRLLSAPTQVQGALGMALSRLFLEAYGLLGDAVIIPLDAHQELAAPQSEQQGPGYRGDLLVVRAEPEGRLLDFLLVETKCYQGFGLSSDLRDEIAAQLASSEGALRAAFDPSWRVLDRIDRAVQNWRLAGVLTFYLDRAVRYRLIDQSAAAALRLFFTDLDAGYTLNVRKVGLVFHPDAAGTALDHMHYEVPIWVVGRDEIARTVETALRAFVADDGHGTEVTETRGQTVEAGARRGAMADDPSWEDVRRTFTPSDRSVVPAIAEDRTGYSTETPSDTDDSHGDADIATVGGDSRSEAGSGDAAAGDAHTGTEAALAVTEELPAYSVLLGDVAPTPQYGLLGVVVAEPWRRVALDLNGCNTISIFGVQGGGKSYTVGTIVEMAVRHIAGLNALPKPLGAVVFHYHQTQDYPPEFVSMREAAAGSSQVQALNDWGAAPTAVEDVLVLTTADTVGLRRREFPHATVEPISFASAELTVADWRFLMGATGNDALYLKLLNEIMRKHRADLTLDAIRSGLADAPVSDSQRALAETRLEFAARFIDDARPLRPLLQPERLIIVDLRDEFIEKDQALGLFVTMLNVFSGAGMGDDPFNKLIVFDEAHKYMSGGTLSGQVIELIREMRHKGVTVVVASQDPINVPSTIIELSSAIILHRFNSPNWLRHIQKSMSPLAELTPSMLSALLPGEAFIWANKAMDPTFARRAVKVRIRPRATKHGGSTQTAVGDRSVGHGSDDADLA